MTTHQQAPPTPDSPTCVAEHPALASPDTEVVKACAVTTNDNSSSSSSSSSFAPSLTTAQDWYDQGEHVWYDPVAKQIVDNSVVVGGAVAENVRDGSLRRAFCRVVNVNPSPPQSPPCTPTAAASEEDLQQRQRWMTFLPGTPEGSYGFHQVEEALRFPDDHKQGCASSNSSDNRGRCDTDATEMSQDSVDSQAEDNDTTAPVYNRQHTQVTHASSRSYDEQEDNGQQAAAAEKDQKEELLEDSDTSSSELSRLYLDYLGQGDSDHLHPPSQKRRGSNGDDLEYLPIPEATATASSTGSGSAEPSSDAATIAPSSTTQRADLVEAHWHALGIQRTVVVSVGDASSLVVMELLHRQRARLQAGTPFPKIMHVLSVNGKYVAKTRQTSQLPAMTQLLRSERMGAALAAKAQRSDFTMSQCLQPYLKGLNQHVTSHYHHLHHEQLQQHQKGAAVGSHHAHAANKQQHIRHVRQQVMDVVRRHGEAAPHAPHAIHSLQDYARTVDDHLQEQHKYRWHLPRLFDLFCQDQGITFQLATTHRHALKQVQLVRDSLVRDYDFDYEDLEETCPGIQYDDWTKNNHSSGNDYYLHHQVSSTAFLLGSSREQLQPLLQAIHRLVNEEIPLSDNTHHGKCDLMKDHSQKISFDDDEEDYDDHSDYHHHPHHEDDSWHMQMSASDLVALEMTNGDHGSQDTRLEKEIVFDADDAALTDDYHLEWAV